MYLRGLKTGGGLALKWFELELLLLMTLNPGRFRPSLYCNPTPLLAVYRYRCHLISGTFNVRPNRHCSRLQPRIQHLVTTMIRTPRTKTRRAQEYVGLPCEPIYVGVEMLGTHLGSSQNPPVFRCLLSDTSTKNATTHHMKFKSAPWGQTVY